MVVTDNEKLAQRIRSLKFHGLGVDAFDRMTLGRKPQAEVLEPGLKYNLTDLQAAIALVQLKRLPELNARRLELAHQYRQALQGLPIAPLALPTIRPACLASVYGARR